MLYFSSEKCLFSKDICLLFQLPLFFCFVFFFFSLLFLLSSFGYVFLDGLQREGFRHDKE